VRDLRPASYKLSARLSVLMLLQGLLIAGLAPINRASLRGNPSASGSSGGSGGHGGRGHGGRGGALIDGLVDPISYVLSFSPPSWGHLSYGQYARTVKWPSW